MTPPPIHKLLRATQSMIPLLPDPWSALAHGLSCTAQELDRNLTEHQEHHALLGLVGESNPALPDAAEWIAHAPAPRGALVRYQLDGPNGKRESLLRLGRYGEQPSFGSCTWFKCGWTLNQVFEGTDPMDPETDRTLLTSPVDAVNFPELEEPDAKLADALLRPRPVRAAVSPWAELAEEIAYPGGVDGVLRSVKQLVLRRVFRRVSFRWSPQGLGLKGCAFAGWKIPMDDAENAARRLAAIKGTAEVALRGSMEEPVLTAIFLVKEKGSGLEVVARIAKAWGREPQFSEAVRVV